jgi:hypothetical protein
MRQSVPAYSSRDILVFSILGKPIVRRSLIKHMLNCLMVSSGMNASRLISSYHWTSQRKDRELAHGIRVKREENKSPIFQLQLSGIWQAPEILIQTVS